MWQKKKSYAYFCDQLQLLSGDDIPCQLPLELLRAKLAEKNMQAQLASKIADAVNTIVDRQLKALSVTLQSDTLCSVDKINAVGTLAVGFKKALFFREWDAIDDIQKLELVAQIKDGYIGFVDNIMSQLGSDVDGMNIDLVFSLVECKNKILIVEKNNG